MLFVRYKLRHIEHNNTTYAHTFPIYSSCASDTCWRHNKMTQCQILLAQTALLHHLLSEIRISYLYTWYIVSFNNILYGHIFTCSIYVGPQAGKLCHTFILVLSSSVSMRLLSYLFHTNGFVSTTSNVEFVLNMTGLKSHSTGIVTAICTAICTVFEVTELHRENLMENFRRVSRYRRGTHVASNVDSFHHSKYWIRDLRCTFGKHLLKRLAPHSTPSWGRLVRERRSSFFNNPPLSTISGWYFQ